MNEEENVRYYTVPEKKKGKGVKNAVIIIGVIFAGLILFSLTMTYSIDKLFTGLGISETASGEIELPHYEYIAQVNVEGTIQKSNSDTFGIPYGYQHIWTMNLINDLINDSNNKGLILFVDSPGGTIYESDELYLRLLEYKNSGKPIYAVMGSMAASGGYYISVPSDKIWANRNTWTGSIGVTLGTYIEITELLDKYGIKTDTITSGKNKAMGSEFVKMSDDQRAILQTLVNEAYMQFAGIVATNRNIPMDKTLEIADGRIYSASQAKDLNLIDEIGTRDDAYFDMQGEYNLKDIPLENFKYKTARWFPALLGSLNKKDSSDLSVIKELMDHNKTLTPMYMAEII